MAVTGTSAWAAGWQSCPRPGSGFGASKDGRNVDRCWQVEHLLQMLGWKVVVAWECETANKEKLQKMLKKKLGM
jgi:G:T-mismatch repair DNA endonuclease (very short patch repair protein)